MDRYCVKENCNVFAVKQESDYCPECKTKLVTHCPNCKLPLGAYNKDQSRGCKHCGQMFKSGR